MTARVNGKSRSYREEVIEMRRFFSYLRECWPLFIALAIPVCGLVMLSRLPSIA